MSYLTTANIYNFIGFLGAVLILLGFYRTSIGKWENKSFIYELDNVVGAILSIIYQWHFHALISAVVNIIWAVVAFRGVTSIVERHYKHFRKRP